MFIILKNNKHLYQIYLPPHFPKEQRKQPRTEKQKSLTGKSGSGNPS
jgi:hypothetical protein